MYKTIPHWLEKQYELNPRKVAMEQQNGRSMTFEELREESRQVAAGIIDQGIQAGDHVALLVGHDINTPIFIHALSYVGAVVVLLNTRLTPSELAFQLMDSDVTTVCVDPNQEQKGKEAVAATANQKSISIYLLEEIPKMDVVTEELHTSFSLDQVFTMMYTSGTTGNPKAVMHTYGNHWFSAIASALNLGLTPNDKWLHCMPMFHVSGFSILIKNVIYGMAITLVSPFDEKVVNQQIIKNKITHISVVTVMMQRLIEDLGNKSYPDDFRCMLLGGGPIPKGLLHDAAGKQIPVFQSYGMTETSSQIATLSPADAFRKIGSAGKALSPAQLVIDTRKSGEVGEILVQGPMISHGYYKHRKTEGEYFKTGDLGYKDEEGYLYVVDRVNDVIISGGENIYPAEVESVINGYPGIKQVGVTRKEDEHWGEVPVAFIVVDPSQIIKLNEVKAYCEVHLAKFKVPKQIYVVSDLPRNASNKILRRRLWTMIDKEDQTNGN